MLGDKDVLATLPVKNIEAARPFYEATLGFRRADPAGDQPTVTTYQAGNTRLLVYQSAFAGTNQATALTIPVGSEIDDLVRRLKAKGVVFERYDMPHTRHEGEVHVMGDLRVAWFKDPDGNIISLVKG